ncbi:MAG: Snf7 family protein [Candidatus Sifarchaeia archaeon]
MPKFLEKLFGKKKVTPQKTVAVLRRTINKLNVTATKYKRQSDEQRVMAKEFLKAGNKIAAKQSLMRRQLYLKQMNTTYNKVFNLQRTISALETAGSNIDVANAMEEADVAIQDALKTASPERIEKTMLRSQEGIERISMTDEILGDTSFAESELDFEEESGLDAEMEALMGELSIESETELPDITPPIDIEPATETEKPAKKKADTKELEKLRKELERELGG